VKSGPQGKRATFDVCKNPVAEKEKPRSARLFFVTSSAGA
jgi:hypothetical protein